MIRPSRWLVQRAKTVQIWGRGRERVKFATRFACSFLALILAVPISGGAETQKGRHVEAGPNMNAAEFASLVTDYLNDLHSRRPSQAAASGIHAWDDRLEDFSAGGIEAEAAAIKRFQERLEKLSPTSLGFSDTIDYQIIASNMRARLLELEQIRTHEHNPQLYSDAISNGLLLLMMFEYAPAETRLRRIIDKEKQIPRLLDAARANVRSSPAIFLKVGLASFNGTLTFVERDLPARFAAVGDAKLHQEFVKTTRKARDAIADYIQYLETMRPDTEASFALGKLNYEAKLRYAEGIDLPVDQLLRIAYRELDRTQTEFRATAAKVDPLRLPLEVWSKVQAAHPRPGTLVEEARKQLDALVRFIEKKQIVSVPPGPGPIVAPTPDYMRWSTASMWSAGPFEAKSLPSRYQITDVDPRWNAEQQEEYLGSINYPQLWTTSIHEAYPGHFVQGAYLRQVESVVRRTWALAPTSFSEGWAHYTEQMMIEEGFGAGDPKIKLGQLADALLRLCRFVVGIRLHTATMTVDQATLFFARNAFMGEVPARLEAERGTFDPTYIVYTVGKLAILKMREDYRRSRGDAFSLREFHDRLLSNGLAPLWAQRQMLMPGDRGKLIE